MCGKWHLGHLPDYLPTTRGFDHYFGLPFGSSSFYRVTAERPLVDEDTVLRPPDDSFYLTDLFTDHAVKFLDQHGRGPKPFFLYAAYTSPHWPLHARPEDVAKYRGKYKLGWDALRERRHKKMIELGIVDKKWPLTERDEDVPAWGHMKHVDEQDLLMAVYAAQIDRMDQNIGRLLAKVKEMRQEENTLILFLADNGGCAEIIDRGKPGAPAGTPDSFLSYGPPWANASNTPFRRYKHWVHEGGIATPLIEAHAGDPVRIHVFGASNEQNGMFSVEKHEWPIEPFMRGADQISVVEFSASESLDAFIPAAGGSFRLPGDYVWSNQRLPYAQSGQWGLLKVLPTDDQRILPLSQQAPSVKRAGSESGEAHASKTSHLIQ